MSSAFEMDLGGLEDKWTLQLEEYPLCAVCGLKIGAEEHTGECAITRAAPRPGPDGAYLSLAGFEDCTDCTCGADEIPILLFRGKGRATLVMAFHFKCARPRIKQMRIGS